VAQRIRAQCRRTPDALAVDSGGTALTYAELDSSAQRLADRLRRQGIAANDRVALLANKLRDEDDLEAVRAYAERHGLEFGGGVPFDAGFPAAEHAGLAPLDHMPDSPAIRAIDEIGQRWADISNRRIPTA